MSVAPLDVWCAADLCADLVVTGDVVPRFGQVEQIVDDYAVELGGSATIFACQFAKLGGKVGLIGAVGEDSFGRMILDGLESAGVETGRIRARSDLKTGLGLALSKPDGDRAILTYLGSIDAPDPSDLTDDLLSTCRHWHLASNFLLTKLKRSWPGWLKRCKAAGLTVSMDTNWDPENRWEGVEELLPPLDLFIPNENEARAISGEATAEAAGEKLSERGPLVVVKCGSDGAVAFKGGERWRIRPEEVGPTPNIVDTTGAGDNFDAGFLRGWLTGWDIDRCLRLATRCAMSSLTAAGGTRGQLIERAD